MAWNHQSRPLKVGVCLASRGSNKQEFTITFAMILSAVRFDTNVFGNKRYRIDHARNDMVEQALDEKCSHILMVDDDIHPCGWDAKTQNLQGIFPPVIQRFLNWHYPIVSGLYFEKEGCWNLRTLSTEQPRKLVKLTMPLEQIAGRVGYFEACATGMMLIDTRVFDKVPYPWFEYRRQGGRGESKVELSEDFTFTLKASQAGFRVLADTNVVGKHGGDVYRWGPSESSTKLN